MREKQFENRVKDFLEEEGIYRAGTPKNLMTKGNHGYWVKRWGGGRYIPEGLPDLQISVEGISLDVELKAENGRVAPLQEQKIAQMREGGCLAFVLRPSQFEDFKKLVRRIKRRERSANRANELLTGTSL